MKMSLGFLIVLLLFLLPNKVYVFAGEVSIIFSGEELGTLEPCGCYDGQLGGISRRYSFIDSFRKQKNIVFPVSFGDLRKNEGRQEEIKLEILCRAMGEMGYVLHNLGEKDLEINPQILSFLSQTSRVNFLSSNIQIAAPFPIKVDQYVIKECFVGGRSFKVAFLGIISQSLINSHVLDYISVLEPVEALKPLIRQLHDKVDLIVLLSHASLEESKEIAKIFSEIGLIITGHNMDEPKEAMYVNNAPIVSSGVGGKYMGVVRYSISKKGVNRKSIDSIPLDNKYKDSKEMIVLLKEYQQALQNEDLLSKTPQAPLPDELSYVGSFSCGMCHKIIYDHWCNTTHGTSYNTLVDIGHQYDPECIQCHTTGYGYVSGFLTFEKNKNLINVGCESCHGAGSGHIKNVESAYGFTDETNCLFCHDSEHSLKFQFKEYWEKIRHPEEKLKKVSNRRE